MALLLWLVHTSGAHAQITPPGMGSAETAAWSALGLRQALDAHHRREYLGYVGLGSTSDQHDVNPLAHANIFVFNHELYDRFHDSWQYSLAASYRRQNSEKGVGNSLREERLQELRLYARFARVWEHARWKALATIRPELRIFSTPSFGPAAEPLQLRLRFKAQLATKLDMRGHQRVLVAAEVLSAIAMGHSPAPVWSEFGYRESRFSLFYAFTYDDHLIIEVGYMNNLIGDQRPLVDVHYLAFDLVWVDPFRRQRG